MNRKKSREWQAKMRDEMRVIMRAAKDQPCLDCGVAYPYYVMHFDHVRGEKAAGISQMIQRPSKYKIEELQREISKCEVVCANCHALRHGGVCYTGG